MDIMLLLKKFTIILLLIALMGTAAALEPLPLGGGRVDEVINLQSGARQPGYVPRMTSSGFATPPTSQTMALDPGAMVHQAGSFMEEARAARDQALAIRDDVLDAQNRTLALAEETKAYRDRAEVYQEKAGQSANSSALSASRSLECADRSQDLMMEVQQRYNDTCNLTENLDNMTRELKMTEMKLTSLNDTMSVYLDLSRELGSVAQALDDLQIRLEELNRDTKSAMDNITSTADL